MPRSENVIDRNNARKNAHALSAFADGSFTVTYTNLSPYIKLPVGVVLDYAGSNAPTGWLICSGQSVPISTYSGLWRIIGYTFGGSGNNFNIPNYDGYVIAGTTNTGLYNTSSGTVNQTYTTKEIEYTPDGAAQVIVDPEGAKTTNLQPTKYLYKIIYAGESTYTFPADEGGGTPIYD